MNLSLPSKTFLVGEYGVLVDGPALVLNTSPRFELKQGLFSDPHGGRGGFGASSIEWLQKREAEILQKRKDWSFDRAKEVIALFKEDSWDGTGLPPSGADLLAQLTGGIALVDFENERLLPTEWPFAALDFFIIRTGFKIPTYQHLKKLSHKESLMPLKKLALDVVSSYESVDEERFIMGLNSFDAQLEELGLCLELTQTLKGTVQASCPDILALKGCGALGADTLFVLFKANKKETVKTQVENLGLEIVSSLVDVTEGLKLES